MDRIYELGDASVPFKYDVHAIYFSEDAVKLEGELHEHFSVVASTGSMIGKSSFSRHPSRSDQFSREKLGNLLEFVENVESTEYLQSIHYWPKHIQPPRPRTYTE